MGYVFAHLALSNPRLPDQPPIDVSARVDSASWLVCIPEALSNQLQLEEADRRPVKLADGRVVSVPYVGPLHLRFEDRQAFAGALVTGDEVLLGAVAMEDMNVVINPREQKLIAVPGTMPGVVGGVRPVE